MNKLKLAFGNSEMKNGIIDSIPIVLGYLSMAITFGFMANKGGLSLLISMLMSILMYAGSSQFMILTLLAAGSGIGEMIFTTFLINFRFLLIGTAFLNKFDDRLGKSKLLVGQTLTDETFTISSFRKEYLTRGYIIGINGSSYFSWIIGTYIGFTFGTVIPPILSESMGIALYAMFISILVPQCRMSKQVVFVILVTIFISVFLTYSKLLPSGWIIIVSIIIPSIIGAFMKSKSRNKE